MRQSSLRPIAAAFVALGLASPWAMSPATPARAETFSVANSDHRNYLYFQVPEATVRRALPDGWQAAPAQSGPTRGANLVVILIDQMAAHNAQGAPAGGGTNQLAVLYVPARNTATGAETLMVFDG